MCVKISSIIWLFGLLSLNSIAQTETPHPGPRSEGEPTLLYAEGTELLADKKFTDAIRNFERLITRYPSHEKIHNAYLSLLDALFAVKKYPELIRYAKELLNLKAPPEKANRATQYLAEANLNLHDYLGARLASDELLKNNPTTRQKAMAYSIKFQSFLEEKQFIESHRQLDALETLIEVERLEPFTRLLPEFKMTLSVRECTISHILRNKEFQEDELTEYFSKKNLCFKSALPLAINGMGETAINEWCTSFTFLNHELERMKLDPFLKEKINKDLKATFEFSKPISIGFYKCYEPYKSKSTKSKKRHRKRRIPKS